MGGEVLWLGGLPRGVTAEEVEEFFKGYGDMSDVQIRSSPNDVFAFVTFHDSRDAEDARSNLDQTEFLRTGKSVQIAKANRKTPGPPRQRSRSRSCRRRDDSRGRPQRSKGRGGFDIWLGGLPREANEDDIRKFVKKFGAPTDIRIRSSAKDTFAFVTFAEERDAQDACRHLDQQRFLWSDNVVQVCESNTRRPDRDVARYERGRDDRDSTRDARRHDDVRWERDRRDDRREIERPRGGRPRRYRVVVTNLPEDMQWAELKDIARTFGETVVYTKCFEDFETRAPTGHIEYTSKEEADYACKNLDNRRMDGHKRKLKAWLEDHS